MNVDTYLNFGGNCAEAFRFYEENLGGKIGMIMTFDQMPGPNQAPPGMEKGVLHAQIEIGGTRLMASDVPAERFQPMRSAYICLHADSDADAERFYGLLSEGGEVFLALQETFFATRYAQLRDRFGVLWMVIHEKPMQGGA